MDGSLFQIGKTGNIDIEKAARYEISGRKI